MDFRLLRIILIDAYCPSRIVELNISDHITLNGENGTGKTTLLRLLPIFFGERPSRILRGNAVTERFGRYYFPTTSSYVVFEYQRRSQKALAVIHASAQSGDGISYRFIDSEYLPQLFKENGQVVQTKDLYRHVDKQGIYITKPLTLHHYQQIIQNTASREFRSQAARFSFVGGTGRLTHLERVVTGILQRATTFQDLKKMIVSSVQRHEEGFSLHTGKGELMAWVNEYEAHFALMAKKPLLLELEQADHHRRITESEFSKLHARFKLLHDEFERQVSQGKTSEIHAKQDLLKTETDYKNSLQRLSDQRTQAESNIKTVANWLQRLDRRKREYDTSSIGEKIAKVEAMTLLVADHAALTQQLNMLEGEIKSLTQIFDDMANQAKDLAKDQKLECEQSAHKIYENASQRIAEQTIIHQEQMRAMRLSHEHELETVSARMVELQSEKSGLEVEVRTTQAEACTQEALDIARQQQSSHRAALETLHEKTASLQLTHQAAVRDFANVEERIHTNEVAIKKAEDERETLLAAHHASEDALIGFLRRHKPDWAATIGKLVDPQTLLRTNLSPMIGQGCDLYGITIDLEKLKSGRFSSEEAIEQEIKFVQQRIDKRQIEVTEIRKLLVKAKEVLDQSNTARLQHDSDVQLAKSAIKAADDQVMIALHHVERSKQQAITSAKENLERCLASLQKAHAIVTETKAIHRHAQTEADQRNTNTIAQIKSDESAQLNQIATQNKAIDTHLQNNLEKIAQDRQTCLKNKGVSTETLDNIRGRIKTCEEQLAEAKSLRSEVYQYREWLEEIWTQKPQQEQALQVATAEEKHCARQIKQLTDERTDVFVQKNATIETICKKIAVDQALQTRARDYMQELSIWPQDPNILEEGLSSTPVDLDQLIAERKKLQHQQRKCLETIRSGVDDIRRQMLSVAGTGPDKFHATALSQHGYPRADKEYEWLETFRAWFNNEYISNQTSLIQQGKTIAQKISAFWNSLNDFKRNISTFAKQLQSSLDQGAVFESISHVSTDIRAHVDTQDYWEAVGHFHQEYDAWHTQDSLACPPASFVAAARGVARVISADGGLVADPIDLISLKISANVNNKGLKTANNEDELANMSSNGLSYIILCVVLIGFVNRIRGNEPVVVPFVVDELKDLSFSNAKTLLKLMTQNSITMIAAFPDLDLDLAELFAQNYKIQADRKIARIKLDIESDTEEDEEITHV